MEFRFNFEDPNNDNSDEWLPSSMANNTCEQELSEETMFSAAEVSCDNVTLDHPYMICHLKVGNVQLAYISTEDIHRTLQDTEDDKRINAALKNHSDLVPGVYEGGLKIWECALDLIHYLDGHNVFMEDMKVLELGCGAGLVGIYAYLKGAMVDFQDYNEEVLRLLTINNVLLNTSNKDISTVSNHCKFFAGDWEAVNKLFSNLNSIQQKYDVIITSETIYNPNNQLKLLHLMKNTLKLNGKIYLAAKSYYFGVGGGTQQFEEIVKKDKTFNASLCLEIPGDIPRKILLLQFKQDCEATNSVARKAF